MLSPEIDALKAQMTAIIVRDSEGFFDDSKESEDLQITVRIACEFLVVSRRRWPGSAESFVRACWARLG